MPIYMDVHNVPGVKAGDVAEAHTKDLLHQDEFSCKCMTYWIDEQRENIFCLIEAPSKEAVEVMHGKAHGLIPNKIIEVNSSLVESFLGRIYDPEDAKVTDEGLKVFSESGFRVLLVTRVADPILIQNKYGKEKSAELYDQHNRIIRKKLVEFGGWEADHGGNGFIISFNSASKAVACALAIREEFSKGDIDQLGLRIGINSGEPVENSNTLFGDTINLAGSLCEIAGKSQVAISNSVKDLIAKDYPQAEKHNFFMLSPQDESLLQLLFTKLEENWQDAEFDVDDYGQAMAMSTSQLYRKTISLTGLSPNILLKDYRLEKAKDLMKKQRYSIAQITFDSGFTSPSYFTKCFKKKYDLLPMTYIDMLH